MRASDSEPRQRSRNRKAIGPRLRVLFFCVAALLAMLGANSVYLAAVTALQSITGQTYENYFYQYMFLGHLSLGLLLILPLVAFLVIHRGNVRRWPGVRVVQLGYALAGTAILILITGVLLMRLGPFELRSPAGRSVVYWLHVALPLVGLWLYWLHRSAGSPIQWRLGTAYAAVVGVLCLATVGLHRADPRPWDAVGPQEGEQYFFPSLARTTTGNFIPAQALMNDQYCLRCHADIHAGWQDSVHRFSSFNNPVYLASVRETREYSRRIDGTVVRARWCAGCHDPVPFFSGAFDDPDYDDVADPTAHAGVTCTACHAITHVNSSRGNADYTIEEPLHYPFAYSEHPALQWLNRQLVKAKPSFHKRTFLKPHHKTAEFCSACHKVHLPPELNDYKFLRGQNHYDSYLLSGVSGHGARSFYYPEQAQTNCNGCHMPLQASTDFGAKYFNGATQLSIHDHLFPSANTGIAYLRDRPDVVRAHQNFLEGVLRVDVFALREGFDIETKPVAPLRPEVPVLQSGGRYLFDVVIRTVKMGHHFTQGTVDSNQIWLDVTVTAGDETIGRSGGLDERGRVDPASHFVNVFMLDRDGNRIDRRNPQDIFVPLYNHQIPPGAGQTVHFALQLPDKVTEPVTVDVKLQYRKFDTDLMEFAIRSARPGDPPIRDAEPGKPYRNTLPITTLAVDRIRFPVAGVSDVPHNDPSPIPEWQRWNDYGIGLLLKGKAELRQAAAAFAELERLGRPDQLLNLARVHYDEGRLDEAVEVMQKAMAADDPAPPPWTTHWLSGLINRQQGHLAAAEEDFRAVLEDRSPEVIRRRFDFSQDYQVINLLGQTRFDLARQMRGDNREAERKEMLRLAVEDFQKTLEIDQENTNAHYNLSLLYELLDDKQQAAEHRQLYVKYKIDDNARDRAVAAARKKYPAADRAAEDVVIYPLNDGAAADIAQPRRRALLNRDFMSHLTEEELEDIRQGEVRAGRQLRRSLLVVAVAALAIGVVIVWLRYPRSQVDADVSAPIAPKLRATAKVEIPDVTFTDVTAEAGIDFEHVNGAAGEKLLPETMGGGCAFFDFDNDQDQDLLFVNSGTWPWSEESADDKPLPNVALYRNDGTGHFDNVTAGCGIELAGYGMGVAVADYDGDGLVDVFLSTVGPNQLYRNLGGGRFEDVTDSAGVAGEPDRWSSSCGFFDYDHDGDLDLFVCNYVRWSREVDLAQGFVLTGVGRAYGPPKYFEGTFSYLYRNEGDGRFADVSAAAGIQVTNPATSVPMGKSLGVRFVDLDRDGWLDIVVANDTVQNFVFHNAQDGSFREIGTESGIAFDSEGNARGAMGIDAAYYRNDRDLGIAIGNFATEMTALYVSLGQDTLFTDEAIAAGLGPPTRLELTFGLFFFDYDLDGRLDLLSANGHVEDEINKVQESQQYRQPAHLFWNAGPDHTSEFLGVPITRCGDDLATPIVGRGSSYADVDNDGDLDVVLTQIGGRPLLLRNNLDGASRLLRFKLVGKPPNRDAIGAWVEIQRDGETLRRQVMPARSYLSQVELPITFGLGDDDRVGRVTVYWPDGSSERVSDYRLNGLTVVRQVE